MYSFIGLFCLALLNALKVKTLKIELAFPSMLLADLDLAFVFPVATTHTVYVRSFGFKTILFDAAQICLHYC